MGAGDPAGAAYFTFHFMRHFIREAEARYKEIVKAHSVQGET